MDVNTLTVTDNCYPPELHQVNPAVNELFWYGNNPNNWLSKPRVAIVGSRKCTAYGREVTYKMAHDLAAAGVVIISGLALGVDSIAHQAALDAGGLTVAVLPNNLTQIYPASHQNLAKKIIEQNGCLVTEYTESSELYKTNFIARNRIVSALCQALLITEASINSGSLHTARFALELGKTVMTVPGNITSQNSEGTNNLIKSGALLVSSVNDIFFELKIKPSNIQKASKFKGTPIEAEVLGLIASGIQSQEEIAAISQLDGASLNSTLTMLEIAGQVRPLGNGHWTLA